MGSQNLDNWMEGYQPDGDPEEVARRYYQFIQLSSKGVWRAEISPPFSIALPVEEQVSAILEKGYVSEGNPALARQLCYDSPQDIVGRPLNEVLRATDGNLADVLHDFVRLGYHLSDVEGWGVDRNGDRRIFLNSVIGIIENDQLVRIWGTHRDITEIRRIEQSLRESEDRFRMLADAAPFPIWMTGPDLKDLYTNRAWSEFVGEPVEPESSHTWSSIVHPDDWPQVEAILEKMKSHQAFQSQFRMRYRDGTYRYMLDTATPRFTADGTFEGYVGTAIDMTDIKEAEVSRARLLDAESLARREAERLNQMKDEFFATVSHELRTPLNAMLGWIQLLQSKKLSPEETSRALSVIERNGRLQSQIIGDLLDMNAISSGRVHLNTSPVHVSELLMQTFETLRPGADAQGIELKLERAEGEERVVSGDRDRLLQIFWNIVSNALKFTQRGGVITATVRSNLTHTTVEIRDTGEGIDPEFLPFVFERFRQSDASRSRNLGGLGLGLAIVKQLVHLHGGVIEAESGGIGHGATFRITFPIAGTSRIPVFQGSMEIDEDHSRFAALNVLVVEDHEDSREFVRRILERGGARVYVAPSAKEAVNILSTTQIDLVISDIAMPDVDGCELIRQIRRMPEERRSRIPAIALTSFSKQTDRARILEAGFQEFLAKPVGQAELFHAISRVASAARVELPKPVLSQRPS